MVNKDFQLQQSSITVSVKCPCQRTRHSWP